MIKRSSVQILTLVLAGFVFAGCASTAAQPDVQPLPSSSQAAPAAKPVQKSPQAGSTASSLDAHREGKTAALSPLKEIYFDFDRYDLRQDARATLQANAAWLKANPSARIEVEGHCDERGTGEYNLALGAKRAQAAKNYLESLGISPQRISTVSYGEELPVCKQTTEECYQQNRRDRFVVVGARPTS